MHAGSKYGPVQETGNRSEASLFIGGLLDKGVDFIEGTLPEEAAQLNQAQVDSQNANEMVPR